MTLPIINPQLLNDIAWNIELAHLRGKERLANVLLYSSRKNRSIDSSNSVPVPYKIILLCNENRYGFLARKYACPRSIISCQVINPNPPKKVKKLVVARKR